MTVHNFVFVSVCDHPGLPENGDTQISTDKMETRYSCHKGYSLVGMESRVCQGAGLGWALGAPVCGKRFQDKMNSSFIFCLYRNSKNTFQYSDTLAFAVITLLLEYIYMTS